VCARACIYVRTLSLSLSLSLSHTHTHTRRCIHTHTHTHTHIHSHAHTHTRTHTHTPCTRGNNGDSVAGTQSNDFLHLVCALWKDHSLRREETICVSVIALIAAVLLAHCLRHRDGFRPHDSLQRPLKRVAKLWLLARKSYGSCSISSMSPATPQEEHRRAHHTLSKHKHCLRCRRLSCGCLNLQKLHFS
jgi:hypothetical protein